MFAHAMKLKAFDFCLSRIYILPSLPGTSYRNTFVSVLRS